jgi:mannose-6-phosphate isomerase-like protein (cupin superfamily)
MEKREIVLNAGQGEILSVMGNRITFLCTGEQTGRAWSLFEGVFPEGSGPPLHHHAWDECYYVIEGEMRFSFADREEVVCAGGFVYAPAGTIHGFKGGSTTPARMLVFDVPAHAEGYFRDAAREVVNLPADVAKVPAIGERHGICFIRKS